MNASASPIAGGEGRTTLYRHRHAWQQRAKTLGHLGPVVVLPFAGQPVLEGREPLMLLVGLEFLVGPPTWS